MAASAMSPVSLACSTAQQSRRFDGTDPSTPTAMRRCAPASA
jgi:hypothetical protein